MTPEPRGHLVPILDHGVTLDRGDHVIVVLDGLGPDEVEREIQEICAMLAQPRRESLQREP